MNIVIFGATGGTGRELVKQGLEKGYHITAFVRNPAALQIKHKNLSVTKGDILDASSVEKAVRGQDVVISALGNKLSLQALREKNTTISQGTNYIITAMQKHHVKRLLFIASFGINKEIFFPQKLFIRVALKNLFVDIPAQESLIKESNLDWTIVHPARLTDGPKTESYHIEEHFYITPFSHISRPDVADFLLKNCRDKDYSRKIVTISY